MSSTQGISENRLVETLLQDTERLLDTLELEKSALRAGDSDALQGAAARKQEQLSALASHLGEVAELDQLAEDPAQFARLREALRRLRDANLSNGYQIVLQRQFVHDAIAALRGQESSADVYGGDAQLPGVRSVRPVAKA